MFALPVAQNTYFPALSMHRNAIYVKAESSLILCKIAIYLSRE